MITHYSIGSDMLRRFVEMNAIDSAFYCKTGNREWTVYIGDAETLIGFEHDKFKTMRDAIAACDEVNRLIKSVK